LEVKHWSTEADGEGWICGWGEFGLGVVEKVVRVEYWWQRNVVRAEVMV
jgi:hypothetical protein